MKKSILSRIFRDNEDRLASWRIPVAPRFLFIFCFPIAFGMLSQCIDPLVVHLPQHTTGLVVDGMITNDPGPYQVKLFYSSKLDTSLARPEFEGGASLWIIDDAGNSEPLHEINSGVYETNASGMRGQLGRSYYLRIKTNSGKEYQSTPHVLTSAGVIDTVYAEYHQKTLILDKVPGPVDAFSIFVDAHGDPSVTNLFRWRWTGTYEVKTYPELRQIFTVAGPIPDPPACSGYIVYLGGIKKTGDCTCCICWTSEYNTTAVVSDNRFVHEENFTKVEIAKLPLTGLRFYDKYYAEVEQLSVSEEEYEFWKLAGTQQKALGSLFQPNSVRVRGNMVSVTDPEEEVLGIFSVSAVTRKSVFFDASQVPFDIEPLIVINEDCRDALANGTLQKPPFW
jgi:Domain of unknown function (DUF4249)